MQRSNGSAQAGAAAEEPSSDYRRRLPLFRRASRVVSALLFLTPLIFAAQGAWPPALFGWLCLFAGWIAGGFWADTDERHARPLELLYEYHALLQSMFAICGQYHEAF